MQNFDSTYCQHILDLILISGTSINNTERQKAESELRVQLQSNNSFLDHLTVLLSNSSTEHKLFIAIQYKNIVDKLNFNNSDILTNKLHNNKINLLNIAINEPSQTVLKQLALLIGKCVRNFWPDKWVDFFPTLLSIINTPDSITSIKYRNCFIVLYHVLKQLNSKRLMSDKKNFETISSSLVAFFLELYERGFNEIYDIQRFIMSENNELLTPNITPETINNLISTLHSFHLLLKVLKLLIAFGISHLDKSIEVKKFFENSINSIPFLLEMLSSTFFPNEEIQRLIYKCIITLIKISSRAQSEHPLQFTVYLSSFLPFFYNFLFHLGQSYQNSYSTQIIDEDDPRSNVAIILLYLVNFLSNVTKYVSHKVHKPGIVFSASKGVEFQENSVLESKTIVTQFFDQTNVHSLIHLLVSSFLPFAASELLQWKEIPVDFFSSLSTSSTETDLRSACENLIHSLISIFPEFVSQIIIELLIQSVNLCPNVSNLTQDSHLFPNFLLKDAIYQSLGICAFEIFPYLQQSHMSFSTLFSEIFQKEIASEGCNSDNISTSIIKFRIINLISQFSDQITTIPQVYDFLLSSIADADLIVRLATLRTFTTVLCEIDSPIEIVDRILDTLLHNIFNLFQQIYDLDTRASVLSLVLALIQKLDKKIISRIPYLIDKLKFAWDIVIRTSQNLLVNHIVRCLSLLISILQTDSIVLHPLIIPLLSNCLADRSFDVIYEELFDLWSIVLVNTPSSDDHLFKIFDFWASFFDTLEHLRILFQIFESYVLLAPSYMFKIHSQRISNIFLVTFSQLNDVGLEAWTKSLMNVFDFFSREMISFMPELVSTILHAFFHQSFKATKSKSAVLIIISRLLLHCFDLVVPLFGKILKTDPYDALSQLIFFFMEDIDLLDQLYHRKLVALAFCNCLTVSNQSFLKLVLGHIIGVVSGVMSEYEHPSNISSSDTLPCFENSSLPPFDKCDETYRKLHYIANDFSSNLDLKNYFHQQLSVLRNSIGESDFANLLHTIDPILLQQIKI